MIVQSIILLVYVAGLLMVRVQPQSLRSSHQESLRERASKIRATLILGCVLIGTAMFSFDHSGLNIMPRWEAILGESQTLTYQHGWVFQLLTSNLAHFNVDHLLGNLVALALLSAYERRVGWRRFIKVFTCAAFLSSVIDLFLLPVNSVALGASAGICGLAAGYYLDEDDLTTQAWLLGIGLLLFLTIALSLLPASGHDSHNVQVNWIGHVLGAVFGAAYVRLYRRIPIEPSCT